MQLEILLFGIAKDICGGSKLMLDAPEMASAAWLKTHLADRFPRLKSLVSWRLAVNENYVEDDFSLSENDEIVVIPPVSGG